MLNIVILSKRHLKKLKEYKLALILTIAVVFVSFSQNPVGIGTVAPHPSAILEVSSTDKGFLPPRMLEEKMRDINSPAGGLIVYCTDCDPTGIYMSDGSGFSSQPLLSVPPPSSVEYLNIDDVSVARGTTSFDISPTLIPSEATVDYALIRNPTGVTMEEGTRIINIPSNLIIGEEYNITVKATGKGDYSGVTGATFKLNVVLPPPADESCFGFGTGTITKYKCPVVVDVVIPASIEGVAVTEIGKDTFKFKGLTSVYIPNSVTHIGDEAFISNGFTSVTIPDSVTSIGTSAFAGNNLTSVIIPDSVTSIGNYAFGTNSLSSVYIGDSVTSIKKSTFYINNLTSVYIPDSVTNIENWAFRDNKLTSVSIKLGTTYTRSGEHASFDSSCTEGNGCITIRP